MNLLNITKKMCSALLLTFALFLITKSSAYAANVKGFNFSAGDILITSDTRSSGLLGHAGIVLPDGKTIISIAGPGHKPKETAISGWLDCYKHTTVIRHNSKSTRIKAANWAKKYYVDGKGKYTPYRITNDPRDLKYTYCSEIAWQAYYYGAGVTYKVMDTGSLGEDNPSLDFKLPFIIAPYDFTNVIVLDYNNFQIVKKFS